MLGRVWWMFDSVRRVFQIEWLCLVYLRQCYPSEQSEREGGHTTAENGQSHGLR